MLTPEPPSHEGSPLRNEVLGPPESVEPSSIYKLYRGSTGKVRGDSVRIWVDFPALQLCWAAYDLPSIPDDRVSLLDLASCRSLVEPAGQEALRVEIYSQASPGTEITRTPSSEDAAVLGEVLVLAVTSGDDSTTLKEFAGSLAQLLESRDQEGRQGLEFIQKRLFQYLWRHSGNAFSEKEAYEAQAVLAFNLDPRGGVAYLREKTGKGTDAEVGAWLAHMSTVKGGMDPTMLGAYFSRRDTLDVFKEFVRCLDFKNADIVAALRLLFDTFKPGGEGQVITRILEYFAEAYFLQWLVSKDSTLPKTEYENADSVLQVAVSLIMLNTGLHVATKKNPGKRVTGAVMTVEEYIGNVRQVVGEREIPDAALTAWYESVKRTEISVEPMPRVAFSKLPVQPDIEGWLIVVLNPTVQHRYWAVLALQRLYLFSDANDMEPAETMDLKDAVVRAVNTDKASKERFAADLKVKSSLNCIQCFTKAGRVDLSDAEARAFEVCQQNFNPDRPQWLEKLSKLGKPRTRLPLVAESADLMEKWVSLISSGPY